MSKGTDIHLKNALHFCLYHLHYSPTYTLCGGTVHFSIANRCFEPITLVADLYVDLIAALVLLPLKKGNFEMKKTTYAIAMAAAITAASLSIPAFAATEAELSTANAEIMALVNAGMSFEDAVAAAIAANPAMAAAIVEAAVTARPELIETILVKAIAAYKGAVGGSGSPAFGEGLKKIVASAVAVVGADSP